MACLLFLLARFSASWLSAPTLPDPPTSCAYATAHAKEGPTEVAGRDQALKAKGCLSGLAYFFYVTSFPFLLLYSVGQGARAFSYWERRR